MKTSCSKILKISKFISSSLSKVFSFICYQTQALSYVYVNGILFSIYGKVLAGYMIIINLSRLGKKRRDH